VSTPGVTTKGEGGTTFCESWDATAATLKKSKRSWKEQRTKQKATFCSSGLRIHHIGNGKLIRTPVFLNGTSMIAVRCAARAA